MNTPDAGSDEVVDYETIAGVREPVPTPRPKRVHVPLSTPLTRRIGPSSSSSLAEWSMLRFSPGIGRARALPGAATA